VNNIIAESSNPLMRGLVAAALNPGLRSILVFDATIDTLTIAAQNLKLMLQKVTDAQITKVQLGVVETEDDLWGQLSLWDEKIEWQQGLLAKGRDQVLQLVVIPDLTRLSLAGARACVTLMGSGIAHLERHGRTNGWVPNLCWLAGCPSRNGETGLVSPHLLDRFALQLSEQIIEMIDADGKARPERVQKIREWIEETDQSRSPSLSPALVTQLQKAHRVRPVVTLESERRVVKYFVDSESYSVRREVALLRLAQVYAQLGGSLRIKQSHVNAAANLIGLRLQESVESDQPLSELDTSSKPTISGESEGDESSSVLKQPKSKTRRSKKIVDDFDDENESLDQEVFLPTGNPYRNDEAPMRREAASLRLPLQRLRTVGRGSSTIIGTEPATVIQDLAIVSTIFEAAKYQKLRCEEGTSEKKLIFHLSDLRRYRRVVVPEQMLAMVIDYTCLQNTQWQNALLPYLQWAYIERANVCLIQVGVAQANTNVSSKA
jgi:magnesium chelatase subunit D